MKKILTLLILIQILFLINNNNKVFSEDKDFVSLINCFFDEAENVIVINWEPLEDPRAVYKIYRLISPIKGKKYSIVETDLIKVVGSNVDKVIDIPTLSGKYYYYISVVIGQKENTNVFIDQNYTYAPIEYYKPSGIVHNMKAKYIPQNSQILLQWEPPTEGEKHKLYSIYRSYNYIDKTNISSAKKIGEIKDKTVFFDRLESAGKFFYAVTTTSIYNFENFNIIKDANNLSKPITVLTLETQKLNEFYIYFPMELNFEFKPEIQWINVPDKLKIISLDISPFYGEEPKIEESEKEQNIEEKKEIKKELSDINDLYKLYVKKQKWDEFLTEADKKIKFIKSEYGKNKLLLFKAVAFYKIKKYEEALLIIKELKSDNKFVKYNNKKILELENKIKQENK